MDKYHSQKGFTLTELMAVIVIISFVVAASFYGRNVINQSRLLSVIRDFNNYRSAVESFKYKYNEIPGDFSIASSYWDACSDSGTNRCDGDGDRIIETTGNENGRAWQHLSLSELVDASYSGNVIGSSSILGEDVAISDIDESGYDLIAFANSQESFGVTLTLATVGANGMDTGTLTADEAHFLDQKIDDGVAITGHVFASPSRDSDENPIADSCLNSATPQDYNILDDVNKCLLHLAIKL